MKVRGIDRLTLTLLLEMGKSSWPNEYMVLLHAEDGIIDEIYSLPGSEGGDDASFIRMDMLPLGMTYAGTAHSHPNGVLLPSDTDYATFAEMGQVHIIVGSPFDEHSWKAFGRDGHPLSLEILEE